MLAYLKRNPTGNSVSIGFITFSLLNTIIGLSSPTPMTEGGLGVEFIVLVVSVLITIFSLKFLIRGSNTNESGLYKSGIETTTLVILGLTNIFFTIFYSGREIEAGFIFYFLFTWVMIVFTRQWPLYKRIIWVVALGFFVVLILSFKL